MRIGEFGAIVSHEDEMAGLVHDALRPLDIFTETPDAGAQDFLQRELPLRAAGNSAFAVRPQKPEFSLTFLLITPNGDDRHRLLSACRPRRDIEKVYHDEIVRDETFFPVFLGAVLRWDTELTGGKFIVSSRDGKLNAICNPNMNSTKLVSIFDDHLRGHHES